MDFFIIKIMIQKNKKFYEIDRYNIDQSLSEISSYFELVKTFSAKSHGHIKYLVYLVNNLIESDDFLNLNDILLKNNGGLKYSKQSRINEEKMTYQN